VVDTLPSFNSPTGVAVDAAGNIFVADYGNNLIRKITPGGLVSTFAGSGFQGSTNATGLLASFKRPTGIAVDASGDLFIADAGNNQIRKITADGAVSTLAGSDSTGSANGVGVNASFFDPLGVAVDHSSKCICG
jgi:streptogramin lyase